MQKTKFILLSNLLLLSSLFTGCNKTKYDLMVVGVNTENFQEVNLIIDSLKQKKKETIDNINYYTGYISNKKTVVVESHFGMAQSSMATTIGIKHFNPKYIINEGTSGGHHVGVKTMDIILGEQILNFASYHGSFEHIEDLELQQPTLYSDKNLLEIAKKVDKKEYSVKEDGVLATSDWWCDDEELIAELNKKFGEDCEEMESYSVSAVALNYKIPSIAIRTISNNIITGQSNIPEACKTIQNFVLDFIELL